MRLRKKRTLCLRAFSDSLAPNASGTNGNLGLLKLIPRLLRIRLGMQKTGQPVFLIRLKAVMPDSRHEHAGNNQDHGCMTELYSAKKKSHQCYWNIGEC